MTYNSLWISALRRLQPIVKKMYFLTWFANTNIVSNEDGVVVLGVPTIFAKNWLFERYNLKILEALQKEDSSIKEIQYEICARFADKGNNEAIDLKDLFNVSKQKKVRKVRNVNEVKVTRTEIEGHVSSQMLNNKYHLDNFVVGSDNRLPHAVSMAVVDTPGGIYNPLYIYGSVGLGKTHLLQSIGNGILEKHPDKIVKYITAERFVTEVVTAIGKRNMSQFKNQYRNVDCFLIDDVQFFARKDSSQQEFFHTFNELYDGNKQIVLTSDRSPSELDGLDERLKSRFAMGMVVEILPPDFETRLAILNEKCKDFEVILDPKVLEFIASNVKRSVRELEGVLRQAVAEAQLSDRVPTLKSIAQIIKRVDKAHDIIGFDVEESVNRFVAKGAVDVKTLVANYYGITIDELEGKDRHKEVMLPRQVCMYLIKNELGFSYDKIGSEFGGRNHTTVMHACNKTSTRLKKDIALVQAINIIKRDMGL